jgi:ribosome-binding protein aMBF1 (putative translation factor)
MMDEAMTAQTIEIAGQQMVVLSKAEFDRLTRAAECYDDICAAVAAKERSDAGEELVPATVVNRILDGESALKVWREFRGYSQDELAAKVGKQGSWLGKMERGDLKGKLPMWRKLASVLDIELDDILPLD